MRMYVLILRFAFIIALLGITQGCKKLYDYMDQHSGDDHKACAIKKAICTAYGVTDTLHFSYNIWGNPVSVLTNDPRTGFPNLFFRYNGTGQLTDYYGTYADGLGIDFWHKFYYYGGKVIADSVFIWALLVNGDPVNANATARTTYQYDSKNRITRTYTTYSTGGAYEANYYYDAAGNRQQTNFQAVYDQKLNFHRTNKIWMFLDREYSVNNPFVATKYNSQGLPTEININGLDKLLTQYFSAAKIEYACK